jgi:ribonuclease HI/2-polyprenyl-3-methyl-5-hydroxy-6-metoxy-1,4-benzoquinol methylase
VTAPVLRAGGAQARGVGRRLIVEADGGSRGNPGPAGYGALVKDAGTGEVLAEIGEAIGTATNNVAEYRGLIAGLTAAVAIDPDCSVEVRMDSKLVVEQMSGRWQVKHEDMRALVKRARSVISSAQVLYTWVPRARNAHADRLANEALDDAAAGKPWRGSTVGAAAAPVAAAPATLFDEEAVVGGCEPADRFGSHDEQWAAWQDEPWGRLRYRIVAHVLQGVCRDLQQNTGRTRLRVLDVGGGDGMDAVPLALAGHDVTVLDSSPTLLRRARERARREGVSLRLVEADLAQLGRVVAARQGTALSAQGTGLPAQGTGLPAQGTAVLEQVRAGGYDLVLCHFVLGYCDDPAATVVDLARLVGPVGALSLAAVNPASEVVLSMVRRSDPAAALAALDAPTAHSVTFGAEIRLLSADQVAMMVRDNGFGTTRRFGIRCLTDYMTDDDRKGEPEVYGQLEALELAVHDQEPFVAMARMWHLVATRST